MTTIQVRFFISNLRTIVNVFGNATRLNQARAMKEAQDTAYCTSYSGRPQCSAITRPYFLFLSPIQHFGSVFQQFSGFLTNPFFSTTCITIKYHHLNNINTATISHPTTIHKFMYIIKTSTTTTNSIIITCTSSNPISFYYRLPVDDSDHNNNNDSKYHPCHNKNSNINYHHDGKHDNKDPAITKTTINEPMSIMSIVSWPKYQPQKTMNIFTAATTSSTTITATTTVLSTSYHQLLIHTVRKNKMMTTTTIMR